jgi:hypothetical protein
MFVQQRAVQNATLSCSFDCTEWGRAVAGDLPPMPPTLRGAHPARASAYA